MNRLEIYGIILAVFVLTLGGAYYKGRADMKDEITTKQLADNAAALNKANRALSERAATDDAARVATQNFINVVNLGLSGINAKFSKLPNVVLDAHGCADLNDNFRLRWNSSAGVPGASGPGAGESSGTVRSEAVRNP